jgi:hypothetical protein
MNLIIFRINTSIIRIFVHPNKEWNKLFVKDFNKPKFKIFFSMVTKIKKFWNSINIILFYLKIKNFKFWLFL